jgi:hypothetical protein
MDHRGGSLLEIRAASEDDEGGGGKTNSLTDTLGVRQPIGAQDIGGLPSHCGFEAHQRPSPGAQV